jgi:hypothetical protein
MNWQGLNMTLENQTSVIISKEHSSKLKNLADHFKRSKTMQLEWMIDIEWLTLFGKEPEPVAVKLLEELPF